MYSVVVADALPHTLLTGASKFKLSDGHEHLPVLHAHGEADPVVRHTYSIPALYFDAVNFDVYPQHMKLIVWVNGMTGEACVGKDD